MSSPDPFAAVPLFVEALEPRIAPAALNEAGFTSVTVGTPILLKAGQGLSTSNTGGAYLLYVEAGQALVFTTDLNGDRQFQPNEITGIAAGDGLKLLAFTDIHGDIVTNLLPNGDLSDSDNDTTNGRDGRILLDNHIEKIELRSLTSADINPNLFPGNSAAARQPPTSHSIFGNIYSGGDFGSPGNGLIITGGGLGTVAGSLPSVGDLRVGTAASYQHFSFGNSVNPDGFGFVDPTRPNPDIQGTLRPFTPAIGEHGADITGVRSFGNTPFGLGVLATGDGGIGGAGIGARGGNLTEITISGDHGGYQLIAGDGGPGTSGGKGGSIVNFTDAGSVTSEVIIHSGKGGRGVFGAGGDGGTVTFAQANITANLRIFLGDGGGGLTAGGNASNQSVAAFTPPSGQVPVGTTALATMRDPYLFTNPDGTVTLDPQPGATHVFTTDPGTGLRIPVHEYTNGTIRPVDFDGDGFFDAVFTTSNPDQIVVLFGGALDNPNLRRGFDQSKTLFLDSPVTPQAITIGDFDGDGRPDIAAASAAPGNTGGVAVFLNQIRDPLRNPNFTGGATVDPRVTFTRSPLGDHPFSGALQSALPFANAPVRSLLAGDFNGDGVMDLAYISGASGGQDQLGVLFGDANAEQPYGSGFFFSNAALSTQPKALFSVGIGPDQQANPLLDAGRGNRPTPATPVHDQLFAGVVGGTVIRNFELLLNNFSPVGVANVPPLDLGVVDTNRLPANALAPNFTPVIFTLLDFTVQDINGDGSPDLVALSLTPNRFVQVLQNSGQGGPNPFALTSGSGVDQAGAAVGGDGGLFGTLANQRAITAFDINNANPIDANGVLRDRPTAQIALLDLRADLPNNLIDQATVSFARSDAAVTLGNGIPPQVITQTNGQDTTVISFDPYRTSAAATAPQYELFNPSQGAAGSDFLDFAGPGGGGQFKFQPLIDQPAFQASDNPGGFGRANLTLTDNGIRLFAGVGGDAVSGPGGQGGSIGKTLSAAAGVNGAVGTVSVIAPAFPSYNGVLEFVGGDGGRGFNVGNGVPTAGGNGGDLTGISVRGSNAGAATAATATTALLAGSGGVGVNGPGGRGGDIASDSVTNGRIFTAGNGGDGLQGGRGGNLVGNGIGVLDVSTGASFVGNAGAGGRGSLAGGAGGEIRNLSPQVTGGDLIYNDRVPIPGFNAGINPTAGDGGAAAGGAAGNGGQVLNSSPSTAVNGIDGTIYVTSGNGGAGLRGGNGGQINTFTNAPTGPVTPQFFNFVSGNGGAGIEDRGGAGGNIQNISVNGIGDVSQTINGLPSNSLLGLRGDRVIAGAGGASFAADGGLGGSVTAVVATSVSTPLAVASGAGGIGLTSGQNGGAIANSTLNAAGTGLRFGKLLVIAGEGGDAYALAPGDVNLPGDPLIPGQPFDLARLVLAFGGQSGTGGNGGSISNLTQPASVQTNVDLIAGNGGSTVNYGASLTPTGNVGRGGGITNANIAGEIGASLLDNSTNTSPPIKAYNDRNGDGVADQSLRDFVQFNLRTGRANPGDNADLTPLVLDNSLGNVGIVAGVAGRVAAVNGVPQPASGVPNGAVQFVTARNIMSIVAGSVNSVSPVDNVIGLRLTSSERILGADKSPLNQNPTGKGNGVPDYLDLTGRVVTNLQPGDRLIDGAIFAFANTTGDLSGQFGNPRVFIVPQG